VSRFSSIPPHTRNGLVDALEAARKAVAAEGGRPASDTLRFFAEVLRRLNDARQSTGAKQAEVDELAFTVYMALNQMANTFVAPTTEQHEAAEQSLKSLLSIIHA
jgi:hypothetical protein